MTLVNSWFTKRKFMDWHHGKHSNKKSHTWFYKTIPLQKAKNCIKFGLILIVDSFKKLKHDNNLSNFEAIKNSLFFILLLFLFTFKQVEQWGGSFAIPLKVFQHT